MNSLKCPNCGNIVVNNSKYCVKCGSYLIDNKEFIDSAADDVNREKQQLLGDIYFCVSDSVDTSLKKSLDAIAKKTKYVYDLILKRPYMYEDARLLISRTMYKTLCQVSELSDLQRKKIEYRAQLATVEDWLEKYQKVLDEITDALVEQGVSDLDIDITVLDSNDTVEFFLKE